MKTDVEQLEENRILLKVEVPPEDFRADLQAAYRRVAGQYRLPGFRKGKAPPQVIDAQLGRGVVYEEMLREALPDFYEKAVKETGIKPVYRPDIEVLKVGHDEPLIFNAKVLVRPKVQLGEYRGLEVEKPAVEVTEEEISARLKRLQERFARLEVVDGAAERGDYILIDYDVYVGDTKLEDASIRDYFVPLETGHLLPGFDDHLVGAPKGEKREFVLPLPADHPNKNVAGKDVTFKAEIKEVKRKILPDLADEFAQQVSEFDTLEELRGDIEEKIRKDQEDKADAKARQNALKKLIEESRMDIPPQMIEAQAQLLEERFRKSLESRGIRVEQYLEATKSSAASLRSSLMEEARSVVENDLVLGAVAEAESIEPSEEDLEAELARMAEQSKKSAPDVRADLERTEQMDNFKEDVRLKKALDWLMEQVNFVPEKEPEPEEAEEATPEPVVADKEE